MAHNGDTYIPGLTYQGEVKAWNAEKGYGWVKCSGMPDIFAHATIVTKTFQAPGSKFSFIPELGQKGWKIVSLVAE